MSTIQTTLVEMILFGITFIPFVYVTGYVAKEVVGKPMLPQVCSKWNENYIMEVNLFLAACLFYIVFVLTGLKDWYISRR